MMATILTATEAATVLRCATTDQDMLDLLPLVDQYIKNATGRDWTADAAVNPTAKAAARMLMTLWHENPAMIGQGIGSLNWGLSAALTQLEALRQYYYTFQGLDGSGSISLPGVKEGDSVVSLIGRVGVSGDQSTSFESLISYDDMIEQTSTSDLSDDWFTAHIVPPSEMEL
jgi:hypothetical protein